MRHPPSGLLASGVADILTDIDEMATQLVQEKACFEIFAHFGHGVVECIEYMRAKSVVKAHTPPWSERKSLAKSVHPKAVSALSRLKLAGCIGVMSDWQRDHKPSRPAVNA